MFSDIEIQLSAFSRQLSANLWKFGASRPTD
jgi:hypothetical protein